MSIHSWVKRRIKGMPSAAPVRVCVCDESETFINYMGEKVNQGWVGGGSVA